MTCPCSRFLLGPELDPFLTQELEICKSSSKQAMVEEPLLTVTVPTIIIAIESSSPKKSYDKVISSLILCLRKPREVKQCA